MRISRFVLISLVLLSGIFLAVLYCNKQVDAAAEGKTFNDVTRVPHNHVGLLLGTGKYIGKTMNLYYAHRIDAAVALFNAGKIDYIIISGDNSRKDYDEPSMMRADLMAAGIDSNRIYLDYAGFRTFDSMIRLREIFSQHSVTVISQQFHNERALFIAQREQIDAIGFNAQDVPNAVGFKTQMREKLARVKVFVDYMLGIEPKFLGPKVPIPA